ncbi:hypothetical protein [Mesorhizobium sp. B2-1-3A]|uniref:hypothetical protein n=1 Tax=Mesorhizobium sp. B2-1-3A TaxID=2589971 RepID=UPI0011287802|nr:hypothetical protein [Mesorhizobium sp. B2-1-3A]TPM92578.1 hypothetical protein FJ977_27145 [Mesorhizobium sp. B2-1-3A]
MAWNISPEPDRVIVELFGPAGSGKTTFAHALQRRLQAQGYVAKVVLSYQPGVHSTPLDPGGLWYAFQRVVRAILRTAAFVFRPLNNADELRLTVKLVRILTPRNPIWLIRFSRYILALSVAWQYSVGDREIVIFDQGFIQAVCSLSLFSGVADTASLATVLDLIPTSDLAISVDAAEPLLSKRLKDRLFHQSYMERLFEADSKTNLQSIPIIRRVKSLLLGKERSTLSIDMSDERSLQEAIFRVEREIAEMRS